MHVGTWKIWSLLVVFCGRMGNAEEPEPEPALATPASGNQKHSICNWEEFANNPGPVPQAITTTTTTTTTNGSISLSDTTSSPNVPSRPILKGDFWESIGTLEIPSNNTYATSRSKVFVPQEASVSRIFLLVHFSELISGTVSTAEIDLQMLTSEADNLVDFGDLILSETEKKAMNPIRLRIKRSNDRFVNLSLYDGDDIEAVVRSFCNEHDMEYFWENLLGLQ
ncbi:hypothetical protein HPULCUR_004440 [Helicostylum pulchrum]|uniref:Uncharacterized protein n=1 Tax=Helicostylum pulchrum TaxID=562976 RepID=A0ABP9XWE8_9FUNG